jgi:hypothetical protein
LSVGLGKKPIDSGRCLGDDSAQNTAEFKHIQNMAILQTSDTLSEDERIDEKISGEASFHLCTIIAT